MPCCVFCDLIVSGRVLGILTRCLVETAWELCAFISTGNDSSLFLYPSQIESKARESLTVVYSKLGLLIVCHVLG